MDPVAKSRPSGRGIGRRRLLFVAGGTLLSGAVACAGLAVAGTRGGKPPISFIESTYEGTGAAGGRVLVAYASQHGSTGGVADAIGSQLASGGPPVDVRQMKNVTDLSPYSAAVVGSAIHGGLWMPEAMEFVQAHQAELGRIPTAVFLACATMWRDTEQTRSRASAFLGPVREVVTPVAEGLLGGALYPGNFPFLQGLGVVVFCLVSGGGPGDHRDWDAIRAWADSTRPLLLRA